MDATLGIRTEMMSRIQLYLRRAWIFIRYADASHVWYDTWGPQDQIALNTFFNSETGKRLRGRLRATSMLHNHRAVLSGRQWKCGYASGYTGTLADLEILTQLSDISDPTDAEPNQDSSRAEDLLDRLAQ